MRKRRFNLPPKEDAPNDAGLNHDAQSFASNPKIGDMAVPRFLDAVGEHINGDWVCLRKWITFGIGITPIYSNTLAKF